MSTKQIKGKDRKEYFKEYYIKTKQKSDKERKENKIKVINHYSNYNNICNCKYCLEDNINYLTIDHINPFTKTNNKEGGHNLYRTLITKNYPEGYQVLCINCNVMKGLKNECPHEIYDKSIIKYKEPVLRHYSKNKLECKCCKDNNIDHLVIDHINGGGKKHRKETKKEGGTNFYKWLVKNNFQKGYQVLCWYCNSQKGNRKSCTCKKNNKKIKTKSIITT